MTTSSLFPRIQLIATGVGQLFPFEFPVSSAAELHVWVDDGPRSDYTVDLLSNGAGGTIAFADNPPQAGQRVTIARILGLTSGPQFSEGGVLRAEALNAEFERLTRLVQQVDEKVARAVKLSPGAAFPAAQDLVLPPGERANRVLSFDGDGQPQLIGEGSIPAGPVGPQGPQGVAGPIGPQGATGPQGSQGVGGPPGSQGNPGPAGPLGPQGPQGATGPQGPQGVQGSAGAPGQSFTPDAIGGYAQRVSHDAAAAGFAFLAADVGQLFFKLSNAAADWSDGIYFGRGEAGPQGPQGIQGLQGLLGPQGVQGPVGATGAQGQRGLTWRGGWLAATAYAVDDAVQHGGSSYVCIAAVSGSMVPADDSVHWSLLAARGLQGIQGPQGETGPVGPTGAQGPQGVQGLVGPLGPQGLPGEDGAPGLGVPHGGNEGQVLAKASNDDGDVVWQDALGGFVEKGGDTMTGPLVAPSLQSNGTAPLATGFLLGSGQDVGYAILHRTREILYEEQQVANCAGIIPNGNCLSNTSWSMPNADWWNWGLGLSYVNPGYDFAGGSSTTNQPVSQTNERIYGSYYLLRTEVGFDVQRRDWKNCNCGQTNCYSNCNCNCNCNCDCTNCSNCK
jgi:hypothetical protein